MRVKHRHRVAARTQEIAKSNISFSFVDGCETLLLSFQLQLQHELLSQIYWKNTQNKRFTQLRSIYNSNYLKTRQIVQFIYL